MKPITHPARVLARRVNSPPRGHGPDRKPCHAVEVVLAKGVKNGLPGLGRALRGELNFQNGRALRINRDQDGLMAGKISSLR